MQMGWTSHMTTRRWYIAITMLSCLLAVATSADCA